ncbi:MAG: (Fe-S)-binding protein [archaeon]
MELFGWLRGLKEKTLYYPGCLTKGILKQEFENYKEIFNRLGIDYVMVPKNEVCCGLPVINAGFRKDAKNLAIKNFGIFKKIGITKIVTSCPSCYHTFNEIYPKFIPSWDIKVEHASVTILRALKKKRIKYKGSEEDRVSVSYHDPCHLGRYSGIYDEPRQVIELLGGKILELKNNRENAICCGGGGGLRANYPDFAKKIAKKRVEYLDSEAQKIISPCGLCHANLKSATEKSVEFSTFVLSRLRGMGR